MTSLTCPSCQERGTFKAIISSRRKHHKERAVLECSVCGHRERFGVKT
jgi:transcription elongation factor Elf1